MVNEIGNCIFMTDKSVYERIICHKKQFLMSSTIAVTDAER